ncbi:hypothetical protein GCM10010404_55220 [Nonomuraea africana]|uniref:[acyl-carrier-protein] S-malonyltransferase n=1 Tax=Nonomuraea africana TaxID=46171 RepID=A0ABR9KV87_9ACTN|nr:hypothetical protein [Nonomuraea africana]MBE1565528.1 [acyl-carrier-protein] S-malonyltransferase [Nonomuraea africana]
MIGLVDGQTVPHDVLDARLRELREGPLHAALPVPGSSEARQMARWVTQVILTEVLCEREALARGLTPLEGPPLDRLAAVELGSINAAAYNGSPWVRAVYQAVTASARVPSAWSAAPPAPTPTLHLVRHALFADRAAATAATPDDLEPLGAIPLGSLPTMIAEALRDRPYGTLAGPVRDALGWHVAIAHAVGDPDTDTDTDALADADSLTQPESTPQPPRPPMAPQASQLPLDRHAPQAPMDGQPSQAPSVAAPSVAASLVAAAARRVFVQWLDVQRATRVRLVHGLEHPGDPRQPDNHHKH